MRERSKASAGWVGTGALVAELGAGDFPAEAMTPDDASAEEGLDGPGSRNIPPRTRNAARKRLLRFIGWAEKRSGRRRGKPSQRVEDKSEESEARNALKAPTGMRWNGHPC